MSAGQSSVSETPLDAAAMIEAYYERGFTDGLPVVPPSNQSVADMLAAGGLPVLLGRACLAISRSKPGVPGFRSPGTFFRASIIANPRLGKVRGDRI